LIFGADADDPFGRASMAVVDSDLDGARDLLIEGPSRNLPTDAFSDVGEMRSVEWGPSWPLTVDLRTAYSRILCGIDTNTVRPSGSISVTSILIACRPPSFGDALFYLVRGIDSGCGGNGSWGATSAGVERTNSDPGACP
jgi:hypothetical protein